MIPVEKVEEGMVLAESVSDRRGRLLIPAGKVLEMRHLGALPMWGVTHVSIEVDETSAIQEELEVLVPWAVDRATEEVTPLFIHANTDHPVVGELLAERVRRRARELQRRDEE